MQNLNKTLEKLRGTYANESIEISGENTDPIHLLELWIAQAIASSCDEPNAFTLSTICNNRPRSRVVLFKGIHDGRLVFYSNFLSHKGEELSLNPYGAMNFLWLPLQRQVRIEGKISKIGDPIADAYFQSRPRGSRIGSIASPQSQVVQNRAQLESMFNETEQKFSEQDFIPRPSHWGGYALEADYFEFWQGRENRMHDRITFRLQDSLWGQERLAP